MYKYEIDFYRDKNGKSEVENFIDDLERKKSSNKDAQAQHKSISYCLRRLKESGINLPTKIAKHIEDGIWELRPGNNRIFYFYYENNTFVMLSYYRKKSQKAPRREIKKAKSNRDKYLRQKGKI